MKHSMTAAAVLAAAALCSCSEKGKGPGGGFRTETATRADVVRTVEATGTVTPRNSPSGIPVGAQVNGRLVKLFVDYNSAVTNGQIVAQIDSRVYEATYKSSVARLHANKANVEVCKATIRSRKAEVELAKKTQARKKALVEKKNAPVADLDAAEEALAKAEAALDSAQASLKSAEASVEQSEADVSQAKANLEYCNIVSPVNGVVIDRKVEEGETVVSSMNAVPVLTIAEDLSKIWVQATIPEADIGGIKEGQPVTFTADAYRKKFTGRVIQIRRASTTTNNVVTFPVIVEAENPGELLFPGMTVTLAIETARAENAVTVPAAALRFRPKEEDMAKVKGEVPRGRKIWLLAADGSIEPVSATEGVTDDTRTALTGEAAAAAEGREVVVGYQIVSGGKGGKDEAKNPFMPKMPQRNKNKGTAPEPRERTK